MGRPLDYGGIEGKYQLRDELQQIVARHCNHFELVHLWYVETEKELY